MKAYLLFATASIVTSTAVAEAPSSVTIDDVSHRGTGCPQGTVDVNLSEDFKALTLTFDDFIADSSSTGNKFDRKDCVIDLTLDAPSGWEYAPFCIDFRGYADLDDGVIGRQTASYRFNQNEFKTLGTMGIRGPFFEDYTRLFALDNNQLHWSRCSETPKRLQNQISRHRRCQRPRPEKENAAWRFSENGDEKEV